MKKIITVLLSAAMLFSLGVASFAAEDDFVESVGAKDAPTIVSPDGYEGNVVATIIDGAGTYKESVTSDQLTITPYDSASDSEIQQALKAAYEKLLTAGIAGVLSDADKQAIAAAGANVDSLVVTDLFDISYTKQDELSEDNKLNVTFSTNLNLQAGDKVFVMAEIDGEWQLIPTSDVTVTEEGYINASFSKLCPVAFMIDTDDSGTVTPPTPGGDDTETPEEPDDTSSSIPVWFWISIAGVSLAAIVLILVFGFKNKKESHT